MTKRMIEVDALLESVRSLTHEMYCQDMMRDYTIVVVDELIDEIQKLSTPAPEPQESIFDAEGWCYDFNKFKDFYSENGFLIKTEYGYTTIKCGEQYRLCLNGVVAWRPLPTLPRGLR